VLGRWKHCLKQARQLWTCKPSPPSYDSLSQEGYLLREQIAKIEIDHARMSVLGRAGRNKPRTPGEVGVLGENLQPSVVFVFPEGADISECWFLHGSIGARRRALKTESN